MIAAFLHLDWHFIRVHLPEFLRGLETSAKIAGIAIAGSLAVGIVLGAARAHRIPVVSQLAAVYVELVRNTPLLVQIFFLFFGLGQLGIRLQPFTVGWLALVIWGGAFNTENFRAGFEAVPKRYREAGLALGFSRLATFFNVTLPIGGRIALPASINTYVSVFKNTSLLTAIAVAELTNVGYDLESNTFKTTEVFFTLGVLYLLVVWTFSVLVRLLESRLALPESR